jgi:chemotaxis protein methyltransferase CheR
MDDQQFRQLLDHFNYSWDGYRRVRKGIKKRVSRHMQQVQCKNIGEYLHTLDSDEELRNQFECEMSVSVSRFFRDRFLWKIIEDQIVPEILKKNRRNVKFWAAGCACGEEAYSFKILWESLEGSFDCMPGLEIWATDINPAYIRRAQDGIYPLSSLKEVPQEFKGIYFTLNGKEGLYRISQSLKKGIVWKVHNLSFELGEFDFQIIFLRNSILTYYQDKLKQSAFQKVIGSLARCGFLIIGSHEELPAESKVLLPFSGRPYIFKKIRG